MKSFLSIFIFILLLYSCSKSTQEVAVNRPSGCDSMMFSYKTDIHPIIAAKCSGFTCHSGGNNNYDFSTYEVFADRARQGKVEYRLLLPASDPQHMPMNDTMSACRVYEVITWIRQGYANN